MSNHNFEVGDFVTVVGYPNRVFEIKEKMPETRVAVDDGETLIYTFESELELHVA